MHPTNKNASPHLTLVPSPSDPAPTSDTSTIGSDLIDEVALAVRLGVSRSTLQSPRPAGALSPMWTRTCSHRHDTPHDQDATAILVVAGL